MIDSRIILRSEYLVIGKLKVNGSNLLAIQSLLFSSTLKVFSQKDSGWTILRTGIPKGLTISDDRAKLRSCSGSVVKPSWLLVMI